MEQKKFRLRLNLFDGIVLALALAVGAFLLWTAMKPQIPDEAVPASTSSVRYTVRLQRCIPGTSELVRTEDQVADNIKNYVVGKVTAVEAVPCRRRVLDRALERFYDGLTPGGELLADTLGAGPGEPSESLGGDGCF